MNRLMVYKIKASQASNLLREGKFSEMKNICEELIEISPDNPNSHIWKGIALGYASKNIRKNVRNKERGFKKFHKGNWNRSWKLWDVFFKRSIAIFNEKEGEI